MRPLTGGGGRKTRDRLARAGAIAVLLGLIVATTGGHGVAWADTSGADSQDRSVSQSESAAGAADDNKGAPAENKGAPNASADEKDTAASDLDTSPATTPDESESAEPETPESEPPESESTESELPESGSALPDDDSATPSIPTKAASSKKAATADIDSAATTAVTSRVTAPSPTKEDDGSSGLADPTSSGLTDVAPVARSLTTLAAASPSTMSTAAVVETTTITPTPVSPIAEIVALPGRIVNAVLQLAGITTAAGTGPSPISPAPIAELLFAVFRRLEDAVGLYEPVAQPIPPSLVYSGPLDTATPTVAQFLNAATTEYVLGGAPGGMTPFVVDGWPLMSTEVSTGMNAKVWVTPQNQIIIAYSGTTGGTNLLFNPLIAISQILTDIQAGFTNETPEAFTQAVDFAQLVQAEAAKRGYAPENIFVTGHSLGGWEAQYVAQQLGLPGIGFESPGLSTTVPGNGADSLFVNTATYGDMAAYLSSDLPGLYPFVPYPYVPGGGLHPHYGPIVMLGDPNASTPMVNSAALWAEGGIIGSLIAVVDLFGNFFASHLPGVQAYHLDIVSDPGVVPWLGINRGPVHTGFGELTIPEFLKAASDAGILVAP